MKYYSVPADFNKETIDKYDHLNKTYPDSQVIETYGNITVDNCIGSGRAADVLPQTDMFDLLEYIEYSRQKGIDFNYTINAPYCPQNRDLTVEGIREIITFLGKLYNAGVRSLTAALPTLIEIIQSLDYDFEIRASVLCQITNPHKAMLYKKMGIDRIVVDESINRDFKTLKKINEVMEGKAEVIANTICHKNCTYRMFHYNQIGGDSIQAGRQPSTDYYKHRCLLRRYEELGNLLRLSWIRPEDMQYYSKIGISYFKLQGRQTVRNGDPLRTLESYFKEDYQGDLLQLLDMFDPLNSFRVILDNKKLEGFLKPFYETENFCENNCHECGYCDRFVQKCIDNNQAREVIRLTSEFYDEYDTFKRNLRTVKADTGKTGGAKKGKPGVIVDLDLDC